MYTHIHTICMYVYTHVGQGRLRLHRAERAAGHASGIKIIMITIIMLLLLLLLLLMIIIMIVILLLLLLIILLIMMIIVPAPGQLRRRGPLAPGARGQGRPGRQTTNTANTHIYIYVSLSLYLSLYI